MESSNNGDNKKQELIEISMWVKTDRKCKGAACECGWGREGERRTHRADTIPNEWANVGLCKELTGQPFLQ